MSAMKPRVATRGKIRVPSRSLAMSEVWDKYWPILSNAIITIQQMQSSTLSFEENFRSTYHLVTYRQGERTYNGVKDLIQKFLQVEVRDKLVPLLDVVERSEQGVHLLKTLREIWLHHMTCIMLMGDILLHLDANYVPQNKMLKTFEMGLVLFRNIVVRSTENPILTTLQTILLDQIKQEREGISIDRSTVKSCIGILLELPEERPNTYVYDTDFQPAFLAQSTNFYRIESENLIRHSDAPEYMRKVESRLQEERERCSHYLAERTEPEVRSIVEVEMIEKHLKTIMDMENSGLRQMLINNRVEDLERMYKLFGRVKTGSKELQQGISEYIKDCGKAINTSASVASSADGTEKGAGPGVAEAIRWVQDVLDLKDRFNDILINAFAKEKAFETAFNAAFETFVNKNPKAPEFISLFIDDKLKKGFRGKSDDEVDTVLSKTTTLFRFLSDKDIFERYYKQHLANRLLHGRSLSDEAERGMITKLKVECGFQFTSKLEGMFTDMKLSEDTMSDFKSAQDQARATTPFELSTTVLTSTFWPVPSTPTLCNYPPEFLRAQEVFERFYTSRHNGRKLTWHCTMGNVDLRAQFDSRKHELNVSTLAAVVLLLFNDVPEGVALGYEAIAQETGLPPEHLKRTLQSVACGKYKILIKEPKSRNIADTDTFTFNRGFSEKMSRIKIQTVASKVENVVEQKDTQQRVEDARKHMAEAAIVRVMKSRKTLEHNELIAEVITQLQVRFSPSPAMIKKRIEALIDREYLERASHDR
ncbi:Cullin-3 [Actinomortierella ambigua]|nr:Cullin-3 [Actinomortierella ambigua]